MAIYQYVFTYTNRRESVTKVWLANPPSNHAQTVRSYISNGAKATELLSRDPAGNALSYYELSQGEHISNQYEIEIHPTPYKNSPTVLTEEERAFYLRSTPIVKITNEVKLLGNDITRGKISDKEKAFAIFRHIRNHYKYIFPPKERGTESFLHSKEGDCGEMSWLYAALCRSQGIPCRTLVGAFVGNG
ncbi:transglutaminase-like domain-containing protein [Rubeoparvulum massiliense]|uniref:transglutaminase-like domain-containing protein n=1 Tax=Rubeoparvulum massiliense TaxID=1631346 RepID=UPI00065E0A39|nr:transglutaminase-like domain-containing protein [Rubeoparvulum massiliense]